jgi:hypothetical protein
LLRHNAISVRKPGGPTTQLNSAGATADDAAITTATTVSFGTTRKVLMPAPALSSLVTRPHVSGIIATPTASATRTRHLRTVPPIRVVIDTAATSSSNLSNAAISAQLPTKWSICEILPSEIDEAQFNSIHQSYQKLDDVPSALMGNSGLIFVKRILMACDNVEYHFILANRLKTGYIKMLSSEVICACRELHVLKVESFKVVAKYCYCMLEIIKWFASSSHSSGYFTSKDNSYQKNILQDFRKLCYEPVSEYPELTQYFKKLYIEKYFFTNKCLGVYSCNL